MKTKPCSASPAWKNEELGLVVMAKIQHLRPAPVEESSSIFLTRYLPEMIGAGVG